MNDFCQALLFRRNTKQVFPAPGIIPVAVLRRHNLHCRNHIGAARRLRSVSWLSFCLCALVVAAMVSLPCVAQNGPPAGDSVALQQLQDQVRELKTMVLQLQQQTVASRAEISQLREELEKRGGASTASETAAIDQQSPAYGVSTTTAQLDQRLDHIDEEQQLLSDKIDTQYQTKVESASKYRVRLSGIVLFNMFGNSGRVDDIDVPTWALEPNPINSSGAVGGTLRQSIIGLETFGPDLWGAHTSANINFDFGGGFPATDNGVNFGLMRLRTAAVRLDWKSTSVIAGQDQLFLAPLSPTSFATLIVPPLSYAGNLWSWTPQLRVEHRFALSADAKITLAGAFMDPLTGESPFGNSYVDFRIPSAGEESRQPAYGGRFAYSHPLFGKTFSLGASGYYSRQNWGFDRIVNGWAGMMDANLPLGSRFELSSFFYRGAAIGGLGAALGRSVLYDGPLNDPATQVIALNDVGGWAQLKFLATPKLEFNAAFGQDSPFSSDFHIFGYNTNSYGPRFITANRAAFGNVIYRPRSDLLLSMEYRRLRSFTIYDSNYDAGQLNMSVGVLF